jgi:uncharacterized damage-inducible protein DinB
MKRYSISLLFLLAGPALAQSAAPASANAGVAANRAVWRQLATYLQQSAEQMPEASYSFRPTPDVRSFGQLIGHLAGTQTLFCSAALGLPGTSEDQIEKSKTSKADLVAALRASTEFCERAYTQTDASASEKTALFGSDQSRMFALTMNAAHDGEHYGNIVTYLRIKGMVPPSSRPSP